MSSRKGDVDRSQPLKVSSLQFIGGPTVLIAVIAALASIVVAIISWNAATSSTDQEYVALAMEILADEESAQPARNWAISVVSELSPTEVSPELASGLLTGDTVLPEQLDPKATRMQILECIKPLAESELSGPVEGAPLPVEAGDEDAMFKEWLIFSLQQSGQLSKANNRIEAYREIVSICVDGPLKDIEQ